MIFIILTHYQWTASERKVFLFPFWIDMAVPVLMVITGYLFSLSINRRGLSLANAYSIKEIISKLLRFIIPFTAAYLIEVAALFLLFGGLPEGTTLLSLYLEGGLGAGSYYFPVMIQVVFILPLISFSVQKRGLYGLLGWFVANIAFEVLKESLHMYPGYYRICALRYLFVLAFGCWLFYRSKEYEDKTGMNVFTILTGVAGMVYIIAFNYLNLVPLFTTQWTTTSVFASLFIVPFMSIIITKRELKNSFLELLGKASFNIFLAQMVYYWIGAPAIYSFTANKILQIILTFILTLTSGVIFYKIETPVTKLIIKKIRTQ